MILDMQGGFLTKERGGVDVKVHSSWNTITALFSFRNYLQTSKWFLLLIFQGKGLMQTFWLLEEIHKGSPPKNKQKMYPSNWKKINVVTKSSKRFAV